jgi:ATP-dependent exoDNAse (exonuclease V) alpha subunit
MPAQKESIHLDYWGHTSAPKDTQDALESQGTDDDIDFILGQVAMQDDEDRVTQSSHHIKLLMMDSDTEKTITKAAEVNTLILGYALTVHKAQGSEWEKVFLLLHNSHATMMQRELIYTAVTRAKKELFIICESDTLEKGILSQRIKGNTLAEKAIYFQGKLDRSELQS